MVLLVLDDRILDLLDQETKFFQKTFFQKTWFFALPIISKTVMVKKY
jgi:hypothetical protein